MSEIISHKNPKSIIAESVKILRTNLQFSNVDGTLKTVMITSSVPGEGKSFTTSNLGVAFAQLGMKVLVVDCDMRRGTQHKQFTVMKVDLKVSAVSSVLAKSNCPKISQNQCGILYRQF